MKGFAESESMHNQYLYTPRPSGGLGSGLFTETINFPSASVFFDIIDRMKRIIFPLILILLIVITGCNMPAANIKSLGYARQTATAGAMEQMVQAALAATESAEPTALPTEEEPEMLISKNDSAAEPAPTAEPTQAPLPTADPNRVPPELPAVFQTSELNKLDTPHTYEEDVCKMIKNRWGEGKAAPGTVVMAIMYHSIVRGESVTQDNAITVTQHQQLIRPGLHRDQHGTVHRVHRKQ